MPSNPLSLYRDLFEQSSEGMIISDRTGRIRQANDAAAEIFGYGSKEELMECSIPDLLPKKKREKHREHIETYFHEPSRRRMGKGRDVEGLRKDGVIFPAEISLNHFTMENGDRLVVSFVADISDRIEGQKQKDLLLFEAHEEERKRMSQELHDGVTQLLAGIQMSLQGLKEDPEPGTIDKLGEMTSEAIQEARALSQDLMPPNLYENGPIQEIGRMMQRIQRSEGMKMELSAPEDDQRYGSSFEITLFRVCQEGVSNAVKHADADSVQVSLKKEEEGISFTIRDDGIGFSRAEMEQEEREDGSGMGMTNIQERVEAFDGELRIGSEPGKGTTIEGYLPFEKQLH